MCLTVASSQGCCAIRCHFCLRLYHKYCVSICSPGLHEFEAQKNHEVDEFRAKMRTFCEEKAQERQMLPWQQWMEYNFPCELEPCCSPVEYGNAKSKNAKIFINVKFEASEVSWARSSAIQKQSNESRRDGADRALGTKIQNRPFVEAYFEYCYLWKTPSDTTNTFNTFFVLFSGTLKS